MSLPRYLTVEKRIGETPLQALERLRAEKGIPTGVPLAYAGRLDPMATGKLLILVGDECRVQEKYHALDKAYEVKVLFGISSDSGDVLGLTTIHQARAVTRNELAKVLGELVGPIELPYPHFSSRTVKGKPLHQWTLEGRLDEIEIPTKRSRIHKLLLRDLYSENAVTVLENVRAKIESIPPVTDPRKELGADFRRTSVRAAWDRVEASGTKEYQVASFSCIASSGTYMRSLAEVIAKHLGTCGLAYSIHRTMMGRYFPLTRGFGLWLKRY